MLILVLGPASTLHTSTVVTAEESYYVYVPDRLTWHRAGRMCNHRQGALATASDAVEIKVLTTFLKSRNISQPVWVDGTVMTHHGKGEFSQLPLTYGFVKTQAKYMDVAVWPCI